MGVWKGRDAPNLFAEAMASVFSVEVEFLGFLEEKNFLRPPWEGGLSCKALLMM